MIKKTATIILALSLILAGITAYAGAYSDQISNIHSSFVSGNTSASSAPQQEVNGIYRCVELLEAIAYKLDI